MIPDTKADPRKVFGAAVTDFARNNENIVVISADSGGSSGFGDFKKEFPNRYFEFGIMEQGAMGISSGLATTGKIPVFCAIAPFVTLRPYEMFRNDIGYMHQNVKIVGRNSGISYSDLGSTHHSLEDFAIIRMIPGVQIIAPEDPSEIVSSVKAMLESPNPVYMRIGNDPIPYLFEEQPFEIGKGRIVRSGKDITIIMTGSVAANVIEAGKLLSGKGIDAEIIAMPTISPIDKDIIVKSASKTKRIMTVEEHYIIGGLGSIVCEINSESINVPVKRLGIAHTYAVSGPYQDLLAYYGLDGKSIAQAAEAFIGKK
jgi:transketolase